MDLVVSVGSACGRVPDHFVEEPGRNDQHEVAWAAGQSRLELWGIEEAKSQIDGRSCRPVVVKAHLPGMQRNSQPDPSRRAVHDVMLAQGGDQVPGQRLDEQRLGYFWLSEDKDAVSPVLDSTSGHGDAAERE